MKLKNLPVCAILLLRLAVSTKAIDINTVVVGNPGNEGELSGSSVPGGDGPDRICGGVDYTYNIGKYEVTAGQYTEFLNAVAATDKYGLYNTNMWSNPDGCKIQRSGSSGHYTYSVASNYANRPVNWVSWGDAARFCNWMQNGQPTGAQGLSTTEDGTYYLNGATSQAALTAVIRESDAVWAIPTEDEWYKAAYHKNDGATGNYWDYPTGTDSTPGRDMSEVTNPGNNANYYGSPWPIDSGAYYLTVAGEFQLSESAYGTFDQGGNVLEWVENAYNSDSLKGLRGGSYFGTLDTLAAATRSGINPTSGSADFGFRVVVIPACIQPPAGDLNGDCKVDFQDLAIMADEWLDCGLEPPEACNQ
jgi:formylglycine-generating enzyme required for sulfatase activity